MRIGEFEKVEVVVPADESELVPRKREEKQDYDMPPPVDQPGWGEGDTPRVN